jgi:hypothetical protein
VTSDVNQLQQPSETTADAAPPPVQICRFMAPPPNYHRISTTLTQSMETNGPTVLRGIRTTIFPINYYLF